MKQIVQYKKNGLIEVVDVPEPQITRRSLKVRTDASLISAGTERSSVELAEKSLAGKAMARPDLVRKVVDSMRTQGIQATLETVRNRLQAASPMGYSIAGRVMEVGADVAGLRPGDLVAGAGVSYANHAEVVVLPRNLAVPIPEGVDVEHAAFATIGAIALQGLRQLEPAIGENFLVIGLGLIGQLTVQLLHANGCRVFATDLRADLIAMAEGEGATGLPSDGALVKRLDDLTGGYGVDGVVITASTESSKPIAVAGEVTREKGRVVVVGAVGLEVPRAPYYGKEIDLRISRSYGPGRYDPLYEEGGVDYPYGYVRFTEQRNMAAFLRLIAEGRIRVGPLITHRFPVDEASRAYDVVKSGDDTLRLGVLLRYPERDAPSQRIVLSKTVPTKGALKVSFIGAGNYATAKLLPRLAKNQSVTFEGICTGTGLSAQDVGKRIGFHFAVADPEDILKSDTDVIFICTRHDSHADLVVRALEAGKHVFVEKPLCLTSEELERCREALSRNSGHLLVGFNRRFAPLTDKVMQFLGEDSAPSAVQIRVNAGSIDRGHWLNDPEIGGGRIIGEACHFVDLAVRLCRSTPVEVFARSVADSVDSPLLAQNVTITLTMANGSVATIGYFASGGARMRKEYVEVFKGGRSAVIDDFIRATFYAESHSSTVKSRRQDKGQGAMIALFMDSIRSDQPLIPNEELLQVSAATIQVVDALATGLPQTIT